MKKRRYIRQGNVKTAKIRSTGMSDHKGTVGPLVKGKGELLMEDAKTAELLSDSFALSSQKKYNEAANKMRMDKEDQEHSRKLSDTLE